MQLRHVAKSTVYCESVKEAAYPDAFVGLIMGTYTLSPIIGLLLAVASLDLGIRSASITQTRLGERTFNDYMSLQ